MIKPILDQDFYSSTVIATAKRQNAAAAETGLQSLTLGALLG
jgi:hypothetical protein